MIDSPKSNTPARALQIVMTPDYRSTNPYQRLLAEALDQLGAHTNFPRRGGRVFPLCSVAREFGADVLHLHWITPFLRGAAIPIYALYAARLLLDIALTRSSGARIVWTIHNKVSHEARHPRLEMWVRRRISRMVDAMIVHSAEIRREVAVDLARPPESFDIVPHASYGDAYGTPPEAREARSELGLECNGRVFLNFGLMRPYKGLRRLLEAWEASRLGTAGHTLLLAGEFNDPGYREEILSAAAPLAGVRFDVGRVPDERVRYYLGACDAVVLPFERILTSGSMHLALTFGKPIVAPRIASVGELLQESGRFAYDPADPNGLRDALCNAATVDLDQDSRESERLRASLQDWDAVAQATLAVYQRVLGKGKLRGSRT